MEVLLHINVRFQPKQRFFIEDKLNNEMKKDNIGEVIGGGTELAETGEPLNCDIEIELFDSKNINKLTKYVNDLELAKGSYLEFNNKKIEIGFKEGLAIYLNGTDLDKSVYQNCDVNYVVDTLIELMKNDGLLCSWFEGPDDTSLYFYGNSFEKMKDDIMSFIDDYPLCQKCKIIKIA